MPTEYKLHFINGEHIELPDPMIATIQRLLDGDMNAHLWNPQVSTRIKQYKPAILGLDSVYASYDPKSDLSGPTYIWPWIPGSPKQLNGTERIYLCCGDVQHENLAGDDPSNPMFSDLDKLSQGEVDNYLKQSLVEDFATIGVSVLSASLFLRSKEKMNRRKFLRSLATASFSGIAAMLTLGRLAPFIDSFMTTNMFSDVLQEVSLATKPFVAKSDWLDARTSLVIAKTKESMIRLNLPPNSGGCVLMGWPHGYDAERLMSDKNERMRLIKLYAAELYSAILPTLNRLNYVRNSSDNQSDLNLTLALFALTDIYEVTQPLKEYVDIITENVVSYSRQFFKRVARFECPEVIQSLQDLGNPYKVDIDLGLDH